MNDLIRPPSLMTVRKPLSKALNLQYHLKQKEIISCSEWTSNMETELLLHVVTVFPFLFTHVIGRGEILQVYSTASSLTPLNLLRRQLSISKQTASQSPSHVSTLLLSTAAAEMTQGQKTDRGQTRRQTGNHRLSRDVCP